MRKYEYCLHRLKICKRPHHYPETMHLYSKNMTNRNFVERHIRDDGCKRVSWMCDVVIMGLSMNFLCAISSLFFLAILGTADLQHKGVWGHDLHDRTTMTWSTTVLSVWRQVRTPFVVRISSHNICFHPWTYETHCDVRRYIIEKEILLHRPSFA